MNPSKLFDAYVYLRMCWNEALGHLRIPIDMFEKGSIALLVMKAFNLDTYLGWVPVLAVVMLAMILYGGHLSLKHGITSRLMSLSNSYNPEIQQILKATTNDK